MLKAFPVYNSEAKLDKTEEKQEGKIIAVG
jgi:hypothetical protein